MLLTAAQRDVVWIFVAAFVLFGLAELAVPRRPSSRDGGQPPLGDSAPDSRRWTANIGLFVLGTSLVIALPLHWPDAWRIDAAIGLGGWRGGSRLVADILLLDLLRYAIHRLHHAVPAIWRLHAIHHSDTRLDVTTSVRHHPVESVLVKLLVLAGAGAWGASLPAIAVYALLLATVPAFHHAAIELPAPIARALRLVIVTPEIHAVHHSADPRDADTNFGMIFPWWDRLFGTYRLPTAGRASDLRFGVEGVAPARAASILGLLALPLTGPWSRDARSGRRA